MKNKILILATSLDVINGYSRYADTVIKGLYTYEVLETSKKIIPNGNKFLKGEFFLKFTYITLLYDIFFVLLFVKSKPSIIHAAIEHYALLAWILSKIWRVPFVITAHGTYSVMLPKKFSIYKKAFNSSNLMIAVSSYTKMNLKLIGIKSNILVISNGIDTELFVNINQKRENIIVFIGNSKKRKGFETVVNICNDVYITQKFKLIIITNDSKINTYLSNVLFDYEILSNINNKHLVEILNKAKINILPSIHIQDNFEGFGYVHAEAIACGCYSIGSENSGNVDIINYDNGFLLNNKNLKFCVDRIIEILSINSYYKKNNGDIMSIVEMNNLYHEAFKKLL